MPPLSPAPCHHGKPPGGCVPCRDVEIRNQLELRIEALEAENEDLRKQLEHRFDIPGPAVQGAASEQSAATNAKCEEMDCGHPSCCKEDGEDGECRWCLDTDPNFSNCDHPPCCEDKDGNCQWCAQLDPGCHSDHPQVCQDEDGVCQWCADVTEAKNEECDELECGHHECALGEDGMCQWCADLAKKQGELGPCGHPRAFVGAIASTEEKCAVCYEINARQVNAAIEARLSVAKRASELGFTDFAEEITGRTAAPLGLRE